MNKNVAEKVAAYRLCIKTLLDCNEGGAFDRLERHRLARKFDYECYLYYDKNRHLLPGTEGYKPYERMVRD